MRKTKARFLARLWGWLTTPFLILAMLWLARGERRATEDRFYDPEIDDGQSSRRDSE